MSTLAKLGKFLFFLMVVAVLGGIIYYHRDNYKVAYENARLAVGFDKPCTKTIVYTIGRFDTQFGESREQFEVSMSKAVSIWNAAIGKEIFRYESSSTLATNKSWWGTNEFVTVNLIYDNRQKSTQQLNGLNSTIESGKSSYDSLKTRYTSLQADYNSAKNAIDAKAAAFQSDKDSYEKDIAYWNSRGGAPKTEYAALEQRRVALNAEAASINVATKQFNDVVNTLNTAARELNATGKSINQTVASYNDVSATNGPEFQEGEYVSDENGQRIDIYQYSNQAKLVRVLAHEFGHALGLDHVADPKAVMYAYNMDPNMQLTTDDIVEMKKVCGVK
jgi:hypothetical protein